VVIRGDQHHVVRQLADHATTLRQQLAASTITTALLIQDHLEKIWRKNMDSGLQVGARRRRKEQHKTTWWRQVIHCEWQ